MFVDRNLIQNGVDHLVLEQFFVDLTILFLVRQDVVGVVAERFIIDLRNAVVCELGSSTSLGLFGSLLGGYFELQFVDVVFLNQAPAHHVYELCEVLFDLFHREFAFVDRVEPVFQESLGHNEICLLQQEFTNVDVQQEFGLA